MLSQAKKKWCLLCVSLHWTVFWQLWTPTLEILDQPVAWDEQNYQAAKSQRKGWKEGRTPADESWARPAGIAPSPRWPLSKQQKKNHQIARLNKKKTSTKELRPRRGVGKLTGWATGNSVAGRLPGLHLRTAALALRHRGRGAGRNREYQNREGTIRLSSPISWSLELTARS